MRTYKDTEAVFQGEFSDNPQNEQYDRVVKDLRNEKRRQKHRLIRENLERYKNNERQLSGKVVDKEVIGALQRTSYITPQHITLIDSILTMPGTTATKEYERRIAVIHAVIVVCDTEEGAPSRPSTPQKRSLDTVDILPASSLPKRQKSTPSDESDDRPTICFICLGNAKLPVIDRLKMFKNPRSLSRYFVNKHIKLFLNNIYCEYNVCGETLMLKSGLLNYA
ncbi:hypothetical protein N7462_005312 [Penicillium macrosclerotiorum]|uniref:uncharacterized protein n=1 Tax=Penicillium macrosclerotiorum TaxID=303699 RepID=UPI0025469A69|nr:uncharacterized protein N7462_005312 [Penicillium macrosclerotiorum]KAJ5682147.1 hypothetical protein N7462_005312 [Penicillium macrosclerotiorum]